MSSPRFLMRFGWREGGAGHSPAVARPTPGIPETFSKMKPPASANGSSLRLRCRRPRGPLTPLVRRRPDRRGAVGDPGAVAHLPRRGDQPGQLDPDALADP